jgi:DNA-binding MarR family transcriptional regulator
MTEQELILELVQHRVKRFLSREKQQTQGILYARTGRGANPQEFEAILQKLSAEGFLTLTASEQRATSVLVTLVAQQEVTNGFVNA